MTALIRERALGPHIAAQSSSESHVIMTASARLAAASAMARSAVVAAGRLGLGTD
jgi:hypothetical protein